MSHGPLEDTGLENPLAVHIRNFPVSLLTQEKFQKCISDWRGVDVVNSSCHQNPNNSTWNGWAIVHFQSQQARNTFLGNENQHYVKDSFGDVHKLKVKKWFEKPGSTYSTNSTASSNKNCSGQIQSTPHQAPAPPPAAKQEIVYREPSLEEFEKRVGESSSKCFRGIIKSYNRGYANESGLSGFIAVTVLKQGKAGEEVVLFHSSCVWLCTVHSHCRGTPDCARRCTSTDNLPAKLKPEAQVYFTARRISSDAPCAVRYQAKSVWQGEPYLPPFVTTPGRHKLDKCLDDYLESLDNDTQTTADVKAEPAASTTPTVVHTSQPRKNNPTGVSSRQKPLTGGLKQLNSDLTKKFVAKVEKKQVPTNFAEAVATAAGGARSDQQYSNTDSGEVAHIVEKAVIESFPAKDRVAVGVQGFGRFYLDPSHFDGNPKDLQSLLTPASNVLVALSLNDNHQGGGGTNTVQSKYVVVKAFADEQEKTLTNGNSPFVSDDNQHLSNSSSIVYKVNKSHVSNRNGRKRTESSVDIDLDELDKYYETQNQISEYLNHHISLLVPELRSSSNYISGLVNNITTAAEQTDDPQAGVQALVKFLNHPKYNISSNERDQFIANYLHFRDTLRTGSGGSLGQVDFAPNSHSTAANDVVNRHHHPRERQPKVDPANEEPSNHAKTNGSTEQPVTNFNLTNLEKEFFNNRQHDTESQSSILRVIILLRKSELQLETFVKMYREHVAQHGKTKSKAFNAKLQAFLAGKITQKMLDETNNYLRSSRISEKILVSCKKVEVYVGGLVNSLCGFLFSHHSNSANRASSQPSSDISTTESLPSPSSSSSSPMRSIASSSSKSVDTTISSSSSADYDQLQSYLVAINAADTQLDKTLMRRKLSLAELYGMYESCAVIGEGSKMKWNLELSKLNLNPAMGVTVFRIAEILWTFFQKNPIERVIELQPPTSFLSVYDSEDFLLLKQNLAFEEMEENLYDGIEIMYYDSQLFANNKDLKDYAGMIGKLWKSLGYTSQNLEDDIQHTLDEENMSFENYFQSVRVALGKWAALLAERKPTKTTKLNIFNVIKATLASYHPNVYEGYNVGEYELSEYTTHNVALFHNIAAKNGDTFNLYAAEGLIVGSLDEFVIVETQFCKVLVHPTTFVKDGQFGIQNLDQIHGFVTLNSVPVYEQPAGDEAAAAPSVLCHVATMAWLSSLRVDSGDQPYPGILMPCSSQFYNDLCEVARRAVKKKETANSNLDLAAVKEGGNLINFGKAWFKHRKLGTSVEFNDLQECLVLMVLIDSGLIESNFLDSTLLAHYREHEILRYMTSGEFIHMFGPFIRCLREYQTLRDFLDGVPASEKLQRFVAEYPSHFEIKVSKEEVIEKEASVEDVHEVKHQEPSHESHVNSDIIKELRAYIERVEKRLAQLEKDMLGKAKPCTNRNDEKPSNNGGAVEGVAASSQQRTRSYVRIWPEQDGEVEEIPTNLDGVLPLSTIRSIFSGAQGLKYRVSSGGRVMWRNLVLENGLVYPPDDGWGDRVYLARGCVNNTMAYAGANSSQHAPVPNTNSNYRPVVSGSGAGAGPAAAAHNNNQFPIGSSSPITTTGEHQMAGAAGSQQPHRQQQQDGQQQQQQHSASSSPQLSSATAGGGGSGRPGARKTPLSQLVVNQTPSSIWGSSPAPILGGISPVSLDFQEASNFGLRDQLS